MVDYPGTHQELLAWFPDNRARLEYLERLRWPDGFVCPRCGAGACRAPGKGLRSSTGPDPHAAVVRNAVAGAASN